MKRIFKNVDGLIVDPVAYTFSIIQKNAGTKIYVGTDSQKKRSVIEYATVIAYRYGRRGCNLIYHRWNVKRKGYGRGDALIERRLTDEIHASIMVAEELSSNSIKIEQIDLDLNGDPQWKSNKLVQMGVGWARGLGYNVSIKPDFQVAVKAANHIVNH